MTAVAILDQEFLPMRAKLLEIAATLDRLDRADGNAANDRRVGQVHSAVETLLRGDAGERAEQIQLLFSRPYDDDWQKEFKMTNDE
jgi:hypothetical protein